MSGIYVNPFTDYGFKKIFGGEASKPILIDLFNALIDNHKPIVDLTFKNNEQLGEIVDTKGVLFDIYCENEAGEQYIVELQKSKQNWFKERTIYYSTFPIRQQVKKGEPSYDLKAVFCIGILDFRFNERKGENIDWLHVVTLKNQHGELFYDKLTYIYLEMPNFTKTESELETRLDKWFYFIKHLDDFQNIPLIFKDEIVFKEAFEKAEIARFNQEQLERYEHSLIAYMDLNAILQTAVGDAVKIAIKENTIRVERDTKIRVEQETIKKLVKSLKANGIAIDMISKITGLANDEIENI